MRGTITICESEQELQERMKRESDVHKRARLQMLYLLRSNQARNRKEVARLLGINRETVGDWLIKYQKGGINALLEMKARGGSESTLPEEVKEALKIRLTDAQGFGTYTELRNWVKERFGIDTTYWVIYYTATKILNTKRINRYHQTKK